ncbi:2-dehydro-3-deoxygalactonokinase [Pseudoruegeria sp. HB172150]|uniref:2-dehydro-3-deoxygalactonokinase n=1 Tax=Pseudoruegeria sp. HB172150 TaxID=2721164 RepID=UPI0015545619|nr:2-dehydro-3-deoxygalactonokinase [Pseudoruegeria sp. HB172150]
MTADWIAVDWGTSNLRAWAMEQHGTVLDHAVADTGMSGLAPDSFEPALLALVEGWLGEGRTPVIACGMVGAKQGWAEAPYRAAPCPATSAALVPALSHDARLDVRIIPGVKQSNPPDVMRGEETQIAGYLAQNPEFDGILCLPGTHTKWVHVSAGEIVSFRSYMTGEIFALLSKQSVLRHSTATSGWDDDAFAEAVADTLSRPESLAGRAFAIRADNLLNGTPAQTGRARLSGLLIGAELADARPYWLGQPVTLIGASELTGIYAAALSVQGVLPEVAEGDPMTLSGLLAAFAASRA